MKRSFRARLAAATALGLIAILPTQALDATDAAPNPDYVWDLTDLYPSAEAWTQAYEGVDGRLPELAQYRGRLGESAVVLAEALDLSSDISKELVRLFVYATLKADEDLRASEHQERRQLAQSLFARFGEATSYMNPELLALGSDTVEGFIAETDDLAHHAVNLRDTLRQEPHTLDGATEQVMAAVSDALGGPQRTYGTFTNAEMPFPTITLSDGQEVQLSAAAYVKHRASPVRADRIKTFQEFWGTYKGFESTLGQLLATHVKSHVFNARSRDYDSAMAAALSGANVPVQVYETLVAETNRGLPTLHRYLRLRARMLGVEDLGYHDIYPELIDLERSYTISDAKEMTLAAADHLGDTYKSMLQEGFAERWMHVEPAPGKRSGAYMFGSAYDVHPYLLLNFQNDYGSVSTFAHEWGHAVHTMLSKERNPYETFSYATFTAELASVGKELILQSDLLAKASSDEERLFYLTYGLEDIRGTFFRQTMFAEFEKTVHEMEERGEALSGPKMTQAYLDLLRRYHGSEEGVMEIDPLYAVEWSYIPHFYRNFYVFQYATSMAGGAAFAERIFAGEEGAAEQYLDVLAAGGSEYPYDLLKRAGVDLATPAPYRALMVRMNRIMDEIEAILDKRPELAMTMEQ